MGAILRLSKCRKYLLVLCSLGHLVESNRLDTNFGGSMLESEWAARKPGDRFDRLAAKCQGYGHKPGEAL